MRLAFIQDDAAILEEELQRQQDEHDVLQPIAKRALGAWSHHNPRYLGSYSVEEFWADDADEPALVNMRVQCPNCKRKIAPFRSRSLIGIDGGWRWVGLDYQEPFTDYLAACGWCGEPLIFSIYSPQ